MATVGDPRVRDAARWLVARHLARARTRAQPPPARLAPATIDTYDDHRIAMCFSLAALGGVAVRINDPACVRKTFPDYFAEFARIARPAKGEHP